MQRRVGDQKRQWVLPAEAEETHDDVEDLYDWGGLDGSIEVLGPDVPEDFRPEDAVDAGYDLVY